MSRNILIQHQNTKLKKCIIILDGMAYIQSQFSFRRPLPNLFKFEQDVVCKVILIFKSILRLRKTSRQRKINIKECKWQILHHYSN